MSTAYHLLYFVNILFAGIAAGGLVMVLLVLSPLLRQFTESASVQLHREFDPRVDRYMPQSVAISGIAAVLLLILDRGALSPSTALTGLGLASTVALALFSEVFNKPINRTIKSWSVEAVPMEYAKLRRQWDRYHALRTGAGILALVCYLAALLVR